MELILAAPPLLRHSLAAIFLSKFDLRGCKAVFLDEDRYLLVLVVGVVHIFVRV